jgi:peptidyl-prolyl cis-trans isomerase C
MRAQNTTSSACKYYLLLGVIVVGFSAFGAEASKSVVVNGVKISGELIDQVVESNISQGAKDSAELRETIKNELIARELLSEEAIKQSLDKSVVVQNQLTLLRNGYLSELVISKYLEKNSVSEEMLKAEYKRQIDVLTGSQQYLISQIVVSTESEAKEIVKNLQAGQAFDKLAKEKSIDPSKQNGGSLGWVLPGQIIPVISNVAINLNKGAVTVSPIQTQFGWHILKLDDKRPFKAPAFDEARAQLTQAVQSQQRTEYVQKLMKAAKIESK